MDNEQIFPKGLLLKKTREAKGLSLETIHEGTKIPIDALRALEEGYTTRTLSPFYQKGFLKIYAQYLEMDLKEILGEEYMPQNVLGKKVPHDSPDENTIVHPDQYQFQKKLEKYVTPERLLLAGKVIGVLVISLFMIKFVGCVKQHMSLQKKKAPVEKVEKINVAKDTRKPKIEKIVKESIPVVSSPKAVSQVVSSVESKPDITDAGVVDQQTESGAALPSAMSSVGDQSLQKSIQVSIRAKKNNWLLVKVDGAVVFQAIFKKGVTKTWSADKEIELSGKNIDQLEFEVNGKMIGVLGRDGRGAKKVVINKNGLSVKK